MMRKINASKVVLAFLGCMTFASGVHAAEIEVKMLNKGTEGVMVFEPALVQIAPGDSVHFIAVDKAHNVASVPGMIPEGATPFSGTMSKDLTVKFDQPGVYGYHCHPHFGMGMVGLVVVGAPVNEDAAKAVEIPSKAKDVFNKLFVLLDAHKKGQK